MRKRIRQTIKGAVLFSSAIAMAVLLLASCSTTEVLSLWRDQDYQQHPKKVLVMAMLKEGTNRRYVEDAFAARFRERNIDAVPAYKVLPGEELPAEETLGEQLRTGNFDTLLLMRIVDETKRARVVPGVVSRYPTIGGWHSYYGRGYTDIYSPSYTVEDKFAVAETSLYDVSTEKPIWTASSETWLADPDRTLIRNFVKVMMDSLRKEKIVP